MDDTTRTARRIAIEDAAYEMLREHGYAGMSMLRVAKAAKASNETLYRWYGDKPGLIRALVDRNVADVRARLGSAETGDAPLDHLAAVAPMLLTMLVGERAVTLNRAAAADRSGALGEAIAAGGRETVAPLIGALVARAIAARGSAMDPKEATVVFLNLLIGDLQIRRVIGVLAEPTPDDIAARARLALTAFERLISAED
ncbi:MAG: TetR/AcrR family transcriptional regulator [Pseudomonadota bacterium]